MKLAASHIAWAAEEDEKALRLLQKYGFCAFIHFREVKK